MSETDGAGQVPAQPGEPAVTSGEKIMAAVSLIFALIIFLIGVDMLTGGKLSGMARQAAEEAGEAASDGSTG